MTLTQTYVNIIQLMLTYLMMKLSLLGCAGWWLAMVTSVPLLPHPTPAFDFYVFARVWKPERARFVVHGLWPSYRNGSWPQFCHPIPEQPWNYSQIQDLGPELQDRWSDTGETQPSWWQHEWDKHGTCALGSPKIDSQLQYFSTSLWLDMWLGANGRLAELGGPDQQPFSAQQLVTALGATPVCETDSTGRLQLSEIRVNVDLDLGAFEPTRDEGNCGTATNIFLQ